MIEEFEAGQSINIIGAIFILVLFIVVGLLAEFAVLRVTKRWIRTKWEPSIYIFGAFLWQPLIIITLIGIAGAIRQLNFQPGQIAQLTSIVGILILLSFLIAIVRLITGWVGFYFEQHNLGSVSIINNFIRALGFLIFVGILLISIGFPISPILTVIGGSSIGISFALREPLANAFSGLQIIASNKIRPGQYIRLSTGEEGFVTDIRWSDTYIRQLANNLIIVPNSVMITTMFTNFDQPEPELAVLFEVGVDYESDLKHVEQVTIEVANEVMQEVTGGVSTFETFIRYHTFADFSINFNVIMRAQGFGDNFLIRHEFVKRLHDRYNQEGITIPFPIRTLHTDPQNRKHVENNFSSKSDEQPRVGDAV
ncbi:MAG: mechanosensitive ion channel family protein [Chloroflexota bacterium]